MFPKGCEIIFIKYHQNVCSRGLTFIKIANSVAIMRCPQLKYGWINMYIFIWLYMSHIIKCGYFLFKPQDGGNSSGLPLTQKEMIELAYLEFIYLLLVFVMQIYFFNLINFFKYRKAEHFHQYWPEKKPFCDNFPKSPLLFRFCFFEPQYDHAII